MKLQKIIKGIKNGTITILESGHQCNPLIEKLEHIYESAVERKKEYEVKVANGEVRDTGSTYEGMVLLYDMRLNPEIGRFVDGIEQYCFNCDANMYVILIDEKTIGYVPTNDYWDIAENSGEKYDYSVKKEDCYKCSASKLTEIKKLEATINVPSGKLIFQNSFNSDKLLEKRDYSKPGLNSILGREKIMKELAKKNVGYGQMGNMSVTIYANEDEIIVGNDSDVYLDNEWYYKKNPDKITDEWLKQVEDYKVFKSILDDGKFEELGDISLGVWRWMCVDETLYKKYGEELDEWSDQVIVNVKSGKYKIEHYYDFPENGDFIYSRLKRK